MTPSGDHALDRAAEQGETLIYANMPDRHYWADIWRFRDLLFMLAWRDVLVRYKQTVFGVAWAVVRPFITMVVFTIIFGRLANLPSHDVPYPLLVFSGMLAWQFFATTFADASNSLVGNANMISKVYFPRMIVPIGSLLVGLVDFALTVVLFLGLAVWYGYALDWRVIFFPLFVALLLLFVFACSLWVSAMNVAYRDFRFIVPFVTQLGTYVSPVGFSSSIVPERWRLIYALNPMVGIIDGFRWCLLRGSTALDWQALGIAVAVIAALLVPGLRFFRRLERRFVDVI